KREDISLSPPARRRERISPSLPLPVEEAREEILQEPKIPEFLNKWPALFDVSE
ncbi:hypothetical protein KUCAC02_018284, partial [Chaenocephalus aceratus]